jgi:hypothetical protein
VGYGVHGSNHDGRQLTTEGILQRPPSSGQFTTAIFHALDMVSADSTYLLYCTTIRWSYPLDLSAGVR